MSRATPILTNFTGGELSPRLAGRVDLAKYYNGCMALENMIIHPHGGASRRPGTKFVAEVKDHAKKVRLVPFEFSATQAYMLEFGQEYVHFYMNNGQIQEITSTKKLLLHCDGDDASTVFTDDGYTGHTVTAYNDAKLDTTNPKFGTARGSFVGPTPYISIPDHADWFFDAAVFTIDFWHYSFVYPTAGTPDLGFWHQSVDNGGNVDGLHMTWHYKTADGKCYLRVILDTAVILEAEYDIPNLPPVGRDKWRHIALIRGWGGNVNDWALCVDGEALDTATVATAVNDVANAFEIGRCRQTIVAASYWYCGGQYFDEFDVEAAAKWEANFSPPTVAYPLSGETSAYEVTTPYLETDLPALKFAQSADILYITHPNYAPRKLSRTGHTDWLLEIIEFQDGPYEDEKTATITPSDVSGTITLAVANGSEKFLLYDGQTGNFTVGDTVTDQTSGATATIIADTDWVAEGVLTLGDVVGIFGDNNEIQDEHTGVANVNGTVGETYLTYDNEAGGPFTVGEVIAMLPSPIVGYLRGLQDDGVTGKMVIEMIEGTFSPNATLTGASSLATCDVVAVSEAMGPVFTSTDTNRLMGLYIGTAWFWVQILTVTGSYNATVVVKSADLPAGPANATKYRMGSWHGDNNYPHCVSFHEQRLLFAATNNRPQTKWGSMAGDYELFTPGTEDVDPFAYTIASDKVNVIRWLKSGIILITGTIGGEWTARGGTDEPITPTNIWVKPATTYGSANVTPIKIGQAILFLQRQGRKLREFVLSPDSIEPVYVAPDMTILAEHITEGGIIYMDYQQEPDSVVWAVRSDGVLLGMTYNRPQEVIGWHRHITDGEFESVAVIPGNGEDQVWVSVKRTIDGSDVRYIEYFTLSLWDDVTDGIYVDSALTYEGAEVTTLSNLDHLEGKEVAILTNKGVHSNQTVSGNVISLDWGVTKAHAGLPYTSVLQTMSLEAGQREGTAQGKVKRIHKATARLYETLGCEVGPDLDNMDTIPFRKAGDPMDQLPPLFTGDKEVVFPGGYTTNAYVFVRQQQPLPLTVLSIIPHMATHDE